MSAGSHLLSIDRAANEPLNLETLRRVDPSVVSIVSMANHMVIYEYDKDDGVWVRR